MRVLARTVAAIAPMQGNRPEIGQVVMPGFLAQIDSDSSPPLAVVVRDSDLISVWSFSQTGIPAGSFVIYDDEVSNCHHAVISSVL